MLLALDGSFQGQNFGPGCGPGLVYVVEQPEVVIVAVAVPATQTTKEVRVGSHFMSYSQVEENCELT